MQQDSENTFRELESKSNKTAKLHSVTVVSETGDEQTRNLPESQSQSESKVIRGMRKISNIIAPKWHGGESLQELEIRDPTTGTGNVASHTHTTHNRPRKFSPIGDQHRKASVSSGDDFQDKEYIPESVVVTVIRGRKISKVEIPFHPSYSLSEDDLTVTNAIKERKISNNKAPHLSRTNETLAAETATEKEEIMESTPAPESVVATTLRRIRKISNILTHSKDDIHDHTAGAADGIVASVIRARKISNEASDLPDKHVPDSVLVTVIRGRKISKVEVPYKEDHEYEHPDVSSGSQGSYGFMTPLPEKTENTTSKCNVVPIPHNAFKDLDQILAPEKLGGEPIIAKTIRFRRISFGNVLSPSKLVGEYQGFDSLEKGQLRLDDSQERVLNLPEAIFDFDAKPYNRISTQIIAAFAANMGAFALGTVLAWSATALPSLRDSGDFPGLDAVQEAWIGSIVTLGAMAACPIAAYTMVNFGRRVTMMWLTIPFVGGWGLIAFANILPFIENPVYTIYFGRIITGFCAGAYSVIAPAYVAETAHEKIRGSLASCFDLMLSVGMCYIYAIGAFSPWWVQALACAIIPIVGHVLLAIAPDSPRFLVEQGKADEAAQSIAWLYGVKADELSVEIAMLKSSVEESQAKPVNFDRVILKMSVLKPILICIVIMFFYVMSAIDAITFYAVDIFQSTETSLDPVIGANILGVVQVVASVPAALIVDKFGRRPLLLLSFFFMCLSLVAFGLFFTLTNDDLDHHLHEQHTWLPVTSLTILLIAYSIGIGPLSMTLLGEVVPSHIKGLTSCIALMVRWGLGFAVTFFFKELGDDLGLDRIYWLFGIVCGLGLIFVYFCIPETKGKSLDDIQMAFIHKSKLKTMAAAQEILSKELHIQIK